MNRKLTAFTILTALLLITGCATSEETIGSKMATDGATSTRLGKSWEKGVAMKEKGARLITKGEQQVIDGNKNINTGKRLTVEGERLVQNSEAEYSATKRLQQTQEE